MNSANLFRTCCLRIADNQSLTSAASQGTVYAGYSLGDWPKELGTISMLRLQASLRELDGCIRQHGGRLWIGDQGLAGVAIELARMAGTTEVHTAADPTPQGRKQEKDAIASCKREGITLHVSGSQLLHEPTIFCNKSGKPFRVFTPFWNALSKQLVANPPAVWNKPPGLAFADNGPGLGVEAVCAQVLREEGISLVAGEKAAQETLLDFISRRLEGYAKDRDYPDRSVTSNLSAALRFGEISPVRVYSKAAIQGKKADKFLSELGWREFSHHVLHQHPDIATTNIKRDYDNFPWTKQKKVFEMWCEGNTGIPIVDAGMRQLRTTGYMHNRVRMLTASFLVKNLMLDWRLGAEHFWDKLLDADLANNYASWQWVAGSGCDAAPYFRIFNPVLQGKRFDPSGEYVRKHLPVLAGLPTKQLHDPWDAPIGVLQSVSVELGGNYPLPMVDIAKSRRVALDAYKSMLERQ